MSDSSLTPASAVTLPNVEAILEGLKPFQRKSVDYVFHRMYGPDHTRRFLLADEVGLGKTLIAKGVIARAIDHLWDKVQRIDVVYICSNHDIARQNINRLNVTGRDDFSLASRITLLPITMGTRQLREQRLNFVSFTPGTSFDLKSSLGIATERALLFNLLQDVWQLRGVAPRYVLRGYASVEGFNREVDRIGASRSIDSQMREQFVANVSRETKLRDEFIDLCGHFHRADAKVIAEAVQRRNSLVGELRTRLARTCLQSLQPDLIILDEFQRFKQLLSQEQASEASQLAHDLFRYSDDNSAARVLLLSATPYKMYTMSHESAEDDHYTDFLDTVRFLLDDPEKISRVESLLKDYRRRIYELPEKNGQSLEAIRSELETFLRAVMCRTERLAVSADRNGMLCEKPAELKLHLGDVESYVGLQKIARALEHHDTVEYWKSSPYLLNFMEDYDLKTRLRDRCRDATVYEAVREQAGRNGVVLSWNKVRGYEAINPQNPRLRDLTAATVDSGAWRMLWVPPSLPYHQLNGPFASSDAGKFTKRLVFSSWHVVPKAVSSLLSYDAERQMVTSFDRDAQNTAEARKGLGRLLNFTRSGDRLAGMPVLGMLYPSFSLAERFDPLLLLGDRANDRLDVNTVVSIFEASARELLAPLIAGFPETGAEDESWYWAAPLLLDQRHDPSVTESWFADERLGEHWSGADESDSEDEDERVGDGDRDDAGWQAHIRAARALLGQAGKSLGRPPRDIAKMVAQLALAGPAVTALRALARVSGKAEVLRDPERRHLAGTIAWGFRSLFNSPDTIALIRGRNREEPYWRRVIEYCADGGLQAVLDEYAHVLRESLGDMSADQSKAARDVAKAITTALTLRVATPGVDRVTTDDETKSVRIDNERLRARFAMRFGDERSDDGKLVSRKDHVRQAFNSPFWPFVLATTSIGQEGLDFHTYCHAVMHWNLPSNPVDLEQREGRVHRYKGHAVRRNVALRYSRSINCDSITDPWNNLFSAAATDQNDTADSTGLSPYWVYTAENGAVIERHVPALPLSREADFFPALQRSLAVYRMVFGQPRQDDLVAYLLDRIPPADVAQYLERLRIDLNPQAVDIVTWAGLPRSSLDVVTVNGDESAEPSSDLSIDGESLSAGATEGAQEPEPEQTATKSVCASDADSGEPGPPPIDEIDRNGVLATIREVFSNGGPRDRDQAIRDVAEALGYRRTGSRIREVLSSEIQTAVRRGILDNTSGQLSLLCRSVDLYTLDHLIDMLLAAMGGAWWIRDDAITAAARHLGFRRTGSNIQLAFRSAINAAIRRGLLERDGADYIRKMR
jgi:hypothetical protein